MAYSCHDCTADILTPWDGELATYDEVHTCVDCNNPICWDCRSTDVRGEDFCSRCSDKLEEADPLAFVH
jgi:DNA-directed RNA polymerase subunit RPC12/RpoP